MEVATTLRTGAELAVVVSDVTGDDRFLIHDHQSICQALVGGVDVDLDAALSEDDE